MKKSLILLLSLLILSGSLFAGGNAPEAADETGGAQFEGLLDVDRSGWEIGTYGGTIYQASLSDPKSFSIITGAETSTTDITGMMYSGLVRRNQFSLEYEPAMAESWEIASDQKTITLKVRRGLQWSDGTPITAEDFVWGVNAIFLNDEVETNYRSGLFVGDEPAVWTKVDDYTIRVELPEVFAGILNLVGMPPLPKHILEPLVAENGPAFVNSYWGVDTADVTSIPACGPFKIKEYVAGEKVVMERNPLYWESDEAGNKLPYLDEFVFVMIPDQDTQLQQFRAGELSWLGLRGEDVSILLEEKSAGNFELYSVGGSASTNFITFNMNFDVLEEPKVTWLNNKKFRQAMAHLIDRDTLIQNVAYGFGYPQYSFIPRFSPYYWEDVDNQALKYDPEAAKALLDEIGYVDSDGDGWREDDKGNKISLILNTNSGNSQREAIGELFSQEAQAIGVEVTFKPEDFNALVTKLLSTFEWDLILIGLTGSVDPISGQNVYPSSGNLHMSHPNQESPIRDWEKAVDAAWEEANLTTDENQRKSGFEKIQKIWIDEIPWAYTYNVAVVHAWRNGIGNIKPHPINGFSWDGIVHRLYFK
jgi:peptide/nickel transport system substrate-binding protein